MSRFPHRGTAALTAVLCLALAGCGTMTEDEAITRSSTASFGTSGGPTSTGTPGPSTTSTKSAPTSAKPSATSGSSSTRGTSTASRPGQPSQTAPRGSSTGAGPTARSTQSGTSSSATRPAPSGPATGSRPGSPPPAPTNPGAFPAGAAFDYQISGSYRPAGGVKILSRDRNEAPAKGYYNICYVNGYQTQPEESAWWRANHPDLLLTVDGQVVVDGEWNELVLDITTPAKRQAIANIVGGWITGCARSGFQAVEIDNLDSFLRGKGRITTAHAAAFASLLSASAHRSGLLIGQKNAPELSAHRRTTGFDFAITEGCQVYNECGYYMSAFGRAVIEIEYTDGPADAFPKACAARGHLISVVLRDRQVEPTGHPDHTSQQCP